MKTRETIELRRILTLLRPGKNTGGRATERRYRRLHEALCNSGLTGIYAHGTLALDCGLIVNDLGGSGWSDRMTQRFPAPKNINGRIFGSLAVRDKVVT